MLAFILKINISRYYNYILTSYSSPTFKILNLISYSIFLIRYLSEGFLKYFFENVLFNFFF